MESEVSQSFLIDSNSISVLAYHFLPLDANNKLGLFIQGCFKQETIVLLQEVWQEIEGVDEIKQALPFLSKRMAKPSTAGPRSVKRAKEDWYNPKARGGMERDEFESHADKYIKKADFHLIATCWELKQSESDESFIDELEQSESDNPFIVVTEESRKENDSKVFRKIPLICQDEGIECINLAQMLQRLGVKIEFKLPRNEERR